MYPPIFETVFASAEVKNALGSSPMRFYMFGDAPHTPVKPYAVWQVITGAPENYLGQVPDMDSWIIQIDVYADKASQTRDAAEALINAIEPVAHVTSFGGEGEDPDTQNKRYSLTTEWWVSR